MLMVQDSGLNGHAPRAPRKVKAGKVEEALAACGLVSRGSLAYKCHLLRFHFEQTAEKGNLVICDECQQISDEQFGDACPYCESENCTSYNGPACEAPVEEKTMTLNDTTALARSNGTTKAIAPSPPSSNSILAGGLSERDLDREVAECIRLKTASVHNYWQLGCALANLYERSLWKQRTDEAGKQRYKSWDAFVNSEIGMTPANASKIMNTARAFSEQEVQQFGTTKLSLLLEVSGETRERLLERVEKGASKREIAEEVKAAKEEQKYVAPEKPVKSKRPRDTTKATTARKEKAKAKSNTTTAVMPTKGRAKMYQAPTGRLEKADWDNLKRARNMARTPVGCIELANDVTLYLTWEQDVEGGYVTSWRLVRKD
jgi:hypothetical protein